VRAFFSVEKLRALLSPIDNDVLIALPDIFIDQRTLPVICVLRMSLSSFSFLRWWIGFEFRKQFATFCFHRFTILAFENELLDEQNKLWWRSNKSVPSKDDIDDTRANLEIS